MLRRIWRTARDWGVLGNALWAAIAVGITGLLPVAAGALPFLTAPVAISIPVYMFVALPLVAIVISVLVVRIFDNQNRAYGRLFGYYRSAYDITHFPYNRAENGTFVAKVLRVMEFVVTANGVTTIGPYFYYSFAPRGRCGCDEIQRPRARCWVNGAQSDGTCDIDLSTSHHSQTTKDKLKLSICALTPYRIGDVVRVELQYEVLGQHAACREELEEYLNHADLKDNYRNRTQKKKRSEMIYGYIRHSAKCTIRVVFPDGFPWRHLDTMEDSFRISGGTRSMDRNTICRIAKVTATANSMQVCFPHGVGAEHGYYIFWEVLAKDVLTSRGFASTPLDANHVIA